MPLLTAASLGIVLILFSVMCMLPRGHHIMVVERSLPASSRRGLLCAEGWREPRFDPTQYVREQRERRKLMAARLHQGLPVADSRSRSNARDRPDHSMRSGNAVG